MLSVMYFISHSNSHLFSYYIFLASICQSSVYKSSQSLTKNYYISYRAARSSEIVGGGGRFGGVVVQFSPPTSEAAGSNLGLGPSCWKGCSYLPMPGGSQCSVHWFPQPVNYPSQYDPGC